MAQEAFQPITNQKTASLYVGDLAPDVTEEMIYNVFISCGSISSVFVCRDRATRRSLGYAYVNFTQHESAEKAMSTMNFVLINGRPCRLMWKRRDPSERKTGKGNLVVKNLPKDVDNKVLQEMFSIIGPILSSKVAIHPKTGESLGYGYVHFAEYDNARTALEKINGLDMNGTVLRVEHYQPKQQKDPETNWTNLFVNGLPIEMDRDQFRNECEKYGPVVSVQVIPHRGGKHAKGFCDFQNHSDALNAMEALQTQDFGTGRALHVDRYRTREEWDRERLKRLEERRAKLKDASKGKNLYVRNFPDDWSDEQLRDAFAPFGTITSGVIMKDANGMSRLFGFVCYTTKEEADKAIEAMNGKMMGSKPLYVAMAQSKEDRQNQYIDLHNHTHPAPYLTNMYYPNMYGQRMMMQQIPSMPMGPVGPYQQRRQGFRPTRQTTGMRGPRPPRQLPRGIIMPGPGGPMGQAMMVPPHMGYQAMQQTVQQALGQAMQQPMGQAMQHHQAMAQHMGQAMPGMPQGMVVPTSMPNVGGAMVPNAAMPSMQEGMGDPKQHHIDALNAMIKQSPPLLEDDLAKMSPDDRRNTIGERLYNLIGKVDDRTAKITGMMLELDVQQLILLCRNAEDLYSKIVEAGQVLDRS